MAIQNKKLIILFDGTWNRADQKTIEGKVCPTNITKLFEAISYYNKKARCPQLTQYIPGIGTRRFERLLGGGFGYGISNTIKEGYRFLTSNYESGDEIYVFGFSRGAYAARSLVGMIKNVGILRREKLYLIDEAYTKYKDKSESWHPKGPDAVKFRRENTWGTEKIRFLGVFDTVGALGAPFGIIIGWIVDRLFKCSFHDTQLSSIVESAYHALAIDERRLPFQPTAMQPHEIHNSSNFEQKWFAGAHSDVGGGVENPGLSDVALTWMAEKASYKGLELNLAMVSNPEVRPNISKVPDNSQSLFYRVPSTLFVKMPGQIGLVAKKYRSAYPFVRWNGDYIRPIQNKGNVSQLIGSNNGTEDPSLNSGEIDLSVINKINTSKSAYFPPNITS